jgi:septum formation protein
MERLLLCSGSPTRAKLLREAGIPFIQKPVPFDEEQIGTDDPYRFVVEASYGKFKTALSLFPRENILTADTVVTDGREIFRKPADREQARQLLLKQSGREIKIVTAMWIKWKGKVHSVVDETLYRFDRFKGEELEQFLDSGEWRGKAGGCVVEGFCKRYIKEVRGYQSTAMGLPVEILLKILRGEW